ncbi:type VI secretion system Vgr family protein [Enterobacter hormaechei]|uniref:type VI secretion system Vgr family protein n=1 Tax=Enterobacter hormaechei TaxID=158836 RepID=UPI003C6C7DB0
MLMSVNTETAFAQGQTTVLEKEGVYASLFEKINLTDSWGAIRAQKGIFISADGRAKAQGRSLIWSLHSHGFQQH